MTQPVTLSPPPTRSTRRPWRAAVAIAVLAGGTLFAVAWYISWAEERDFEAALAETDRLDPGWRLDDLEAARAAIPDEENVALVVVKIHQAYGRSVYLGDRIENGIGNVPRNTQLDAEQTGALQQFFAKQGDARTLVKKLATLTTGRYASRYDASINNVNFDSVQALRTVMRFVQLDCMLAAQQNEDERAMVLCRSGIVLARSAGDEPNLIAHLVRVACIAITVDMIERTLAMTTPPPDELLRLQRLLEREIDEPRLWVAIRGERALGMRMLEAVQEGRVKRSTLVATKGWRSWAADWLPGTVTLSRANYLRAANDLVEASKLPAEKQLDAMTERVERWQQSDAVLALSLPAFHKVTLAHVRGQAQLRCAALAVAAERYRQEHDHWPASLETLVNAGHLKAVPLDPFDGQPLRYKRLPDGVVIYSVGHDRIDDGGVIDHTAPMGPGTDAGFRLWDVAARRQRAK